MKHAQKHIFAYDHIYFSYIYISQHHTYFFEKDRIDM